MSKTDKTPETEKRGLIQTLTDFVSRMLLKLPFLFIVIVAIVYGFLLLKITTLSNIEPDQTDVGAEISKLSPHIDQKAAAQLQSLEDNSVNVQTLFNQARDNPFGE